jgi:hypothetical protein
MRRSIAPLVALGILSGCTDASRGERGLVLFDTGRRYREVSGLEAEVAVGLPLRLTLRPARGRDFPAGIAERVALKALALDGGAARVEPLGGLDYRLTFDKPGAYLLVAERDGAPYDQIEVFAEEPAGLDIVWLSTARCEVELDDICSCPAGYEPAPGITLRPGQRLRLTVAPLSADGAAMLGELALSGEPLDDLSISADDDGIAANRFFLDADRELALGEGAQEEVEVTLATPDGLSTSLTLTLDTTPLCCED